MLEWCKHGDLHDRVSKQGPCDDGEAAQIMRGILRALSHVHDLGLVHRDVKPENIMIAEGPDGCRPLLGDFGIAAGLADDLAMSARCGSPGYVAPEVLEGKRYDCKVDV